MKAGDVTLLENTRFHEGETKGNVALAKEIAAMGDIFVMDAFSAAHRDHASSAGIAEFLPAFAGVWPTHSSSPKVITSGLPSARKTLKTQP